MKIAFEGIENVFDCTGNCRWTLVVENQIKLYGILSDLVLQLNGNTGTTVLSEDNKLIRTDQNLDLLSQFVPFDLNKKSLINKIMQQMQKEALTEEYFLQTQELLGQWEKLCLDVTLDFPGDIKLTKITVESLFKATGVQIENEYERLSEKLLDYFELVEAYEGKKLFVLLNVRSFIVDSEMELLLKEIVERNYEVLFLENTEHTLLPYEKRYIVDEDLCNIC